MVELQLQAVPAQAILLCEGEGVVPLGPQPHLTEFLPVDDHGAGEVFLLRGVLREGGPVLHLQVDLVDPPVVEEAEDIAGRGMGRLNAQPLSLGKHQDDAHGQS